MHFVTEGAVSKTIAAEIARVEAELQFEQAAIAALETQIPRVARLPTLSEAVRLVTDGPTEAPGW